MALAVSAAMGFAPIGEAVCAGALWFFGMAVTEILALAVQSL